MIIQIVELLNHFSFLVRSEKSDDHHAWRPTRVSARISQSKGKMFGIQVVYKSGGSFTHRIMRYYTILYAAYWEVRKEESGWKHVHMYGVTHELKFIDTDIILNRNIFAFWLSRTLQ